MDHRRADPVPSPPARRPIPGKRHGNKWSVGLSLAPETRAAVVTARARQRTTSAAVILESVRQAYDRVVDDHRAGRLDARLARLRSDLGAPSRQPTFILLTEREARTLQVLADRVGLPLSSLVTLSMHEPVVTWSPVGRPSADEGSSSRAADRRSQMRGHIRSTALDLFADRGFRATTIDEIADAAFVSRRTFFNYFGSKADVVISTVDDASVLLRRCWVAASGLAEDDAVVASGAFARLAATLLAEPSRRFLDALRLVDTDTELQGMASARMLAWEDDLVAFIAARRDLDERGRLELRIDVATALVTARVLLQHWSRGPGRSVHADPTRAALEALGAPPATLTPLPCHRCDDHVRAACPGEGPLVCDVLEG